MTALNKKVAQHEKLSNIGPTLLHSLKFYKTQAQNTNVQAHNTIFSKTSSLLKLFQEV